MFRFLESIKISNGQIFNLIWHQDRVNLTFAKFFPNQQALQLNQQIDLNNLNPEITYKCRIVYEQHLVSIEYQPYTPKVIRQFKLVPINNFEYSYKFADRRFFDQQLIAYPNFDDLIFTRDNLITDSTYANLVFENNSELFTPSSPLLPGTTRAKLLATKKIKEARIEIKDLKNFSRFYLINAMLGEELYPAYDPQQISS